MAYQKTSVDKKVGHRHTSERAHVKQGAQEHEECGASTPMEKSLIVMPIAVLQFCGLSGNYKKYATDWRLCEQRQTGRYQTTVSLLGCIIL